MKNYKKIFVTLTLTLSFNLSLYAMSSPDEPEEGAVSHIIPSPSLVQEIALDEQEILEDDTLFIPLEDQREQFLLDENLILDHTTKQSYTNTKLKPALGLSIDGGGGRGVMSAIWLKMLKETLEDKGLDTPLSEVFDCIGGTSIGGILGLGTAIDLDPDKLINLFVEHGKRIFPSQFSKVKLKALGGLVGCKYSPDPLETLLQEQLGSEIMFGEVNSKVIVTACTTAGKPKLFKSFSEEDKDHFIWHIGRSTSAAPTYFPAFSLAGDHYVDGGMWINNPSPLVATTMVNELHGGTYSPSNLYVLSLGTGDMSLHTTLSKNAGISEVGNIINLLMQSNSQGNHENMQSFLGNNYYRVNCLLDKKIDLAATDEKTIGWLIQCAEHGSKTQKVINEFAEKFVDLHRTRL